MEHTKKLTYKEPEQKVTKINLVIIITPIILILLLISGIAFYVFVYTADSNNIKSYLNESDYICQNNVCSKMINDKNHSFNTKTLELTVNAYNMNLHITKEKITFEDITNNEICTYTKDNYVPYKPIDYTYTTKTKCEKYIPTINEEIKLYNEILSSLEIM